MVKRFIDLIGSLVMIILLSPLMLALAGVIRVTLGAPVIFRQLRPGLHGKLFTIYKFRTMTDARDAEGNLLPDEQRATRIGMLIEKTSLDELPELFNVLKGNMSLVGPRPWLPAYLARYTPEQARRHDVKPGITGLAQVKGRRSIPFSKRLELDIQYVDNRSLWLDLKILLETVPRVLFSRGVADQVSGPIDDVGLIRPLSGSDRHGQ